MAMPAAQRHFAVVAGAVAVAVLAASLANVPGARANGLEQFPGPSDPADPEGVAAWLAQWRGWREATRKANNYTGAIYNVTQLAWTKTEYIQPQMHPYDQFFYNVTSHNYTVGRFLQDLQNRYGGIDALLLWPTYTNIGVDDRSQFDFFAAMPGGLPAVRTVIQELHAAGVKVLLPYNPWDSGTRRDPAGRDDATLLDTLIRAVDADGFNGDTMGSVPEEFFTTSVNLSHPIAIEPEGGGDAVSAAWDTLGWGYYSYPQVVSVDRWKWLDPRRLTNICERWSKNHSDALQYALFNGDGFESWENVWGTWNGITPRDGEAIRRVGSLLRFLGGRGYLQSQGWVPHVMTAAPGALYASQWPMGDSMAWTVVNRGATNHTGPALVLPEMAAGYRFFDLYHGAEVKPVAAATAFARGSERVGDGAAAAHIALDIEAGGFGAVLATRAAPDANLTAFLGEMARMTAVPLYTLDATWRYLLQRRVPAEATKRFTSAPPGTVAVPGGEFLFRVSGVEIEGGGGSITDNPYGVDVQFEWEPRPNRFHEQAMTMDPFFMDKYPVTQGQFHAYIRANPAALPSDTFNYLKNWDWGGEPSAASAGDTAAPTLPAPFPENVDVPVTYIGLEEARAYCRSLGKRLPRSEEWQYAGQGGDPDRTYPWGPDNNSAMYPVLQSGTSLPGALNVSAFSPMADSPFGVADMIGNVWQYTDEFGDDHTRSVILRGGSNYRPAGSHWYFPQAASLAVHNKYFLMDARYERAGTLGFRCAADAALPPCAAGLCLRMDPPRAYTDLDLIGGQGWLAWANASSTVPTVRAGAANVVRLALPDATVACAASQVAVSWASGAGAGAVTANSSAAVCITGGVGVTIHVAKAGHHVVTIVAGGQHGVSANGTLTDGASSFNASKQFSPPTAASAPVNVAWTFRFTTMAAGAELKVWLKALPAPPPPQPPCAAGLLCMVLDKENMANINVDLTGPARSDWAHYGLTDAASVDRMKVAGPRLIGPLNATKGGKTVRYANSVVTFSWTDGTPTAKAAATPTGVYNGGAHGEGFVVDVSVPRSSTDVVVRVYLGIYNSAGIITAALLDEHGGLLGAVNDTSLQGSQQNAAYRIAVRPGATGRTLRLSWVQTQSGGNVNLQAVTVDAAASCHGAVCGRRESGASDVDLSEVGTLDWAHWGSSPQNVTAADRKRGEAATRLIGPIKGSGGPVMQYANNPTTFTWVDGQPEVSVSKSPTGVYVEGKHDSLSTTVALPATDQPVVVHVYVGVYGDVAGSFNATVVGDPSSFFADAFAHEGASIANGVYEIGLSPASKPRTLALSWAQVSGQGGGNIELQAVAVQGAAASGGGVRPERDAGVVLSLQAVALQ